MKKYLHILLFLASISTLGLYVNLVEPMIEKPATLAGFYVILFSTVFAGIYMILRRWGSGRVLLLISFIVSLAVVYLSALSTLNSLGLLDVLIVIVSTSLLIAFVVGPLRKRRN